MKDEYHVDIYWERHEIMKEISIMPEQAIIQSKDLEMGRAPGQARCSWY